MNPGRLEEALDWLSRVCVRTTIMRLDWVKKPIDHQQARNFA
jgi:hypothetical protein